MPLEVYTTPGGATTRSWVCRRCGEEFPKEELVDDLCEDCIDDDFEDDSDAGEF